MDIEEKANLCLNECENRCSICGNCDEICGPKYEKFKPRVKTNRQRLRKIGIDVSIFQYSRVVEEYKKSTGETNAPLDNVCKWLDQEAK
jgi:hypothetical protein